MINGNATTERPSSNGGTGAVFRFSATPEAPSKARLAAENVLQEGYAELIETSMLLISELVTNCVRHAKLEPDKPIELKITTFGNGVKIDVVDYGVGFRYKPREAGLDRAGGWGLYMVDQLAHRWGINDGYPTTVWFELQKSNNSPRRY